MGNAKRLRKKYDTPIHPWQKERLDEEAKIRKDYGTVNKKEIWKMNTKLKNFLDTAKRVSSPRTEQESKEREQLFARLTRLGLIQEGQGVDEVLSLKIDDLMGRRLQTLVQKRGLALTVKQARQMITHRHIKVGDKIVTAPSYFVKASEEDSIQYVGKSPFSNAEHPERTKKTKEEYEQIKELKKAEAAAASEAEKPEENPDLTKPVEAQ